MPKSSKKDQTPPTKAKSTKKSKGSKRKADELDNRSPSPASAAGGGSSNSSKKTLELFVYRQDPIVAGRQNEIRILLPLNDPKLKLKVKMLTKRKMLELNTLILALIRRHNDNSLSDKTLDDLKANLPNMLLYNACPTTSAQLGVNVAKNTPLVFRDDGSWTATRLHWFAAEDCAAVRQAGFLTRREVQPASIVTTTTARRAAPPKAKGGAEGKEAKADGGHAALVAPIVKKKANMTQRQLLNSYQKTLESLHAAESKSLIQSMIVEDRDRQAKDKEAKAVQRAADKAAKEAEKSSSSSSSSSDGAEPPKKKRRTAASPSPARSPKVAA